MRCSQVKIRDNFKSRKTPPYGCKLFDSYSQPVNNCKIGLLVRLSFNYNPPSTNTPLHDFVWRNNGFGPRYFVCASLRFSNPDIWRCECSPNDRDAEPIDLQQPSVEFFGSEWIDLFFRSNCIGLDCCVTSQVKVVQNWIAIPNLLLLPLKLLPVRIRH